ncbi:ATP-binding protein [Streptomyces diastatochromogenes]|nr:ATP-binding protein [Streptomyces diastatochromogenes]
MGRAALLTSLCRQVDAAVAGRGGLVLLAGSRASGRRRSPRKSWATRGASGQRWRGELRGRGHRAGSVALAADPPRGHRTGGAARRGRRDAGAGRRGGRAGGAVRGIAERLLEGGGPLVLVLDDLQWADTASVLLLGRLGRRAGHEALLVVGTYRDVELAPDHPLLSLTDADVVVLGGLAPEEVAVLMDRFGADAGPEAAAALQRRTGGNPSSSSRSPGCARRAGTAGRCRSRSDRRWPGAWPGCRTGRPACWAPPRSSAAGAAPTVWPVPRPYRPPRCRSSWSPR